MKKYLKNFSLLIVFSAFGIFIAAVVLFFCCFILAISPLLAFHIRSLLNVSIQKDDI